VKKKKREGKQLSGAAEMLPFQKDEKEKGKKHRLRAGSGKKVVPILKKGKRGEKRGRGTKKGHKRKG